MQTPGTPAVLLMLLASLTAQADAPLQLDPVQVISTATRTEQPIAGVSASVQVIDQRMIELSGAQTLKDVFAATPGLTLQYGTFPSGSAASKGSVSLRGIGATGTLWLLDGRRLAGEVKNPYDMDRIPAAAIERIEIVKGPMSALYGADAVGGVINIITKQPKAGELSGQVGLGYGSNRHGAGDNANLNVNLRGGSEQLRFSLYGSRLQTDPYTEVELTRTRLGSPKTPPPLAGVQASYAVPVSYREDSQVHTLGGRLVWLVSPATEVGLEANWFDEEREGTYRGKFHPTGFSPKPGKRVPAFDVPVRSRDDNRRRDIALDISHQASEQLDLQARVYQSHYRKRNTTTLLNYRDFAYPSEAASSASGLNGNVDVRALEGSAIWYSANNAHTLTSGFELRKEEREASVFTQGSDLSTRQVTSKALYLQDEWQVTDGLRLTLSGRYDAYTQDSYLDALGNWRDDSTDSKTTFRIGANQALNEHVNVRANLAQGYRVPDIRELYIQKQTPAGMQLGALTIDPRRGKQAYDLEPESTRSVELGMSGRYQKFTYDVSIFHNDIDDRIEQVQVGSGPTSYFTFENISQARTRGLELALQYALTEQLQLQAAWAELDSENKETGQALELTPERMLSAGAKWRASPQFTLGGQVAYTGSQHYSENGQKRQADGFTLLDVYASYRFAGKDGWQLHGGVRNLADADVDKRLGANPGRYFHLGLRYHF